MSSGIHSKLSRVRKPRVHLSYEVEKEGGRVIKDLPFVVGIVGDFSGNPTSELKSLKERKFTKIDRDNFDDVMKQMAPGLNLRVENTFAKDGKTELAVQLRFQSMADFEPANVAKQVEPLRKLLETRDKLQELLTKVDGSDKLEGLLEQILTNADELKKASADLGVQAGERSDKGGDQ